MAGREEYLLDPSMEGVNDLLRNTLGQSESASATLMDESEPRYHLETLADTFAPYLDEVAMEYAIGPYNSDYASTPAQCSANSMPTPAGMEYSPVTPLEFASPRWPCRPTPRAERAARVPDIYEYLAATGLAVDPGVVDVEASIPIYPVCEHVWFDVRNVLPWVDFNMSALGSCLPISQCLFSVCPKHFSDPPQELGYSGKVPLRHAHTQLLSRVNHALAQYFGPGLVQIMPATSDGQQPDFIFFYIPYPRDSTLPPGAGQARVVGICRCSQHWNSGQRNGNRLDQRAYLGGLADIQAAMRLYGTRYGFIITETELVCVRQPTDPDDDTVPLFGALELSASIPLAATGTSADPRTALVLTAGVAVVSEVLLADDVPVHGHPHWRLLSKPLVEARQFRMRERDAWMPPILQSDERAIRPVRGWADPKERAKKRLHR